MSGSTNDRRSPKKPKDPKKPKKPKRGIDIMWSDVLMAVGILALFPAGILLGWQLSGAERKVDALVAESLKSPPNGRPEEIWGWHDYYHHDSYHHDGGCSNGTAPWKKY
jgi:hypothetical protein